MTVAEDLHARLDLDHTLFSNRHNMAPREEKAGQGLEVSAAQAAAWEKGWRLGLRSFHNLILNGIGGGKPSKLKEFGDAYFRLCLQGL
jgi:hypothetical protein